MKFNLIQGIGMNEVSSMSPKAIAKLRKQVVFNIEVAKKHEQTGIVDHQKYLLEIIDDVLDI